CGGDRTREGDHLTTDSCQQIPSESESAGSAAWITFSAILPFWLALLEEGINAFPDVPREHVLNHHFSRVAISVLKSAFELLVEGFLADLDRIRRLRGDLAPERERLFPFIPGSDHAINESDAQGILRRDHL